MLEYIVGGIADHWMLSTYVSVVVFNEGAILAAFSLLEGSGAEKYLGVAAASVAGAFTNDLILYAMARYGWKIFSLDDGDRTSRSAETIFQKIFLRNAFLSLLFIKFLFGFRIALTLYLVVKKKLPFFRYAAYDLLGILLYVSVLGCIGWLVGKGVERIDSIYHSLALSITIVVSLILFTHLVIFIYRRMRK
jgi:membrane protein DedA with SNARE-associated domain